LKTLCIVPIRNLNDNFLKSIHSLFSITHNELFFLLCFDNVRLEDNSTVEYWNQFEKLLSSTDSWCQGKIILINSIKRNGYIRNCNVGIRFAKSTFSSIELFFFGSDHDFWHRNFLNYPLAVFSKEKAVGLVVPQMGDIIENKIYKKRLGTVYGLPRKKFSGKNSGYEIMGVFRLNNFPLFLNALLPDRLLLNIYKVKAMVRYENNAQIKYLRRKNKIDKFSIKRQRRNLWGENYRTMTGQFIPWRLQHFFWLLVAFFKHRILNRDKSYSFSWLLWTNFYNFRSVKPIRYWIKKKRDIQKLMFPKKHRG